LKKLSGSSSLTGLGVCHRLSQVQSEAVPDCNVASTLSVSMFQKLHQELPGHLDRLRVGLAAHDVAAVCEHAHKLNGVAGYFGVQALALAARDLEHIARTEPLDLVQAYFIVVEREITRTLAS
jgi:HPt (histidine-containing phosphotransfer) domain-containing protein